jgi:hypothetical protein
MIEQLVTYFSPQNSRICPGVFNQGFAVRKVMLWKINLHPVNIPPTIHNHLHIKTDAGTTQYAATWRVSNSRHSYNTNKKR